MEVIVNVCICLTKFSLVLKQFEIISSQSEDKYGDVIQSIPVQVTEESKRKELMPKNHYKFGN